MVNCHHATAGQFMSKEKKLIHYLSMRAEDNNTQNPNYKGEMNDLTKEILKIKTKKYIR